MCGSLRLLLLSAGLRIFLVTALLGIFSQGVGAQDLARDLPGLREQVWNTECAFARSMAQRDFAGFEALLSEQAVFFGEGAPLQGRAAVAARWKAFFGAAEAPFAWEPDQVVVLGDGSLAQSSGPVRNARGELIGRFFSVWRQEAPGRWRIVLDRGGPVSDADRAAGFGKACLR